METSFINFYLWILWRLYQEFLSCHFMAVLSKVVHSGTNRTYDYNKNTGPNDKAYNEFEHWSVTLYQGYRRILKKTTNNSTFIGREIL